MNEIKDQQHNFHKRQSGKQKTPQPRI